MREGRAETPIKRKVNYDYQQHEIQDPDNIHIHYLYNTLFYSER